MVSDKTFPDKATTDQTELNWIVLWLDRRVLESQCTLKVRTKNFTDETIVR